LRILHLERERGTETRRDIGLTCDEFCSGAVRGEKFIPTRNSASWRSILKSTLFSSQKYSQKYPLRFSKVLSSVQIHSLEILCKLEVPSQKYSLQCLYIYMSQATDF
jgi:hypothetical protein